MKRFLLFAIVALVVFSIQARNDYDSYNVKRADELIAEDQYASAAKYLDKELEANPTNGFAWLQYARAYAGSELYSDAMTCINKAIKYLEPDCRNEYMSYVIGLKGGIYYGMKDWSSAIDTYTAAIKLDKSSDKLYFWRAQCYYQKDEWNKCYNDCQKVFQLSGEYKYAAYNLLGDCYFAQKKYSKAIGFYDNVIEDVNEATQSMMDRALTSRAMCNWELGNKRGAVDDAINAIDYGNIYGYIFLQKMARDETVYPLVATKIKAKIVKSERPSFWQILLGICNSVRNKPVEAMEYFVDASNANDVNRDFLNNRVYSLLKNYCVFDNIESFYQKELETADNNVNIKIDYAYKVLDPAGKSSEAVELLDECIEEDPDNAYAYYARARVKCYQNRLREAIDDYSMAILLDENYLFNYNERASCYRQLGQNEKARDDNNVVLAHEANVDDDDDEDAFNILYALFYLGKTSEAKRGLQKLQKDVFFEHYNAACLWSLLGDKAQALDAMRQSFENGNRDFNHINRDTDLDNIRNTQEFKSMVSKYKRIHEDEKTKINELLKDFNHGDGVPLPSRRTNKESRDDTERLLSNTTLSGEKVTIPFTFENGLAKVSCSVNGLPLSFIFDTGASKVTISSIEATFMYKNGYLNRSDFGSAEYFSTASGEVAEGTVVTLRSVDIGGIKLSNVKATVVHNQNAPLLLGQTALSRLGKIEIDNRNKMLIVEPK